MTTVMTTTEHSESASETAAGRYPFREIEQKWKARWEAAGIYRVSEGTDRPKYYVLEMFPYPSGSGLHVGHCKNYVPGDVVARMMHMRGYNVLYPMGWDAFGQPAEQDAIKKNTNPRRVVPELAKEYRRQLSVLGNSYDWDREINSTDPDYYRWNQWAFLRLYEKGLAYRAEAPVNWCVNESTVLANEEVVENRCWRCDGPVEKRNLPQWFFKVTAYADKLLEGLERIDWPEGIKTQQRDWIGRSEGVEFDIPVEGANSDAAKIRVFTTRVDTVFGMSFVVLSPEHPLVAQVTTDAQKAVVQAYREKAASLSDVDRTAEGRERTGVFTGAYGVNPVSGHRVPIYIADYVLMGYGTGAIMAVPAHDERDFDFARRYNLPTPIVIVATKAETDTPTGDGSELTAAFTSYDGYVVNSGQFSCLECKVAMRRIAEWMESEGIGTRKINYRLRDWLVSRQRYWGTPIPMIHCPECGVVPVPESDLPVILPDVDNYAPTGDGKSPLAAIPEFVNTTCPKCGSTAAQRETDTMAGSVDSSWYFLRYTSPHTQNAPWDRAAADYWMPVDMYLGGREHAVGHLLYSRFFTKFFFDEGLISVDEFARVLKNQGMLLGLTAVDKKTGHPIKPDEMNRFSPEQVEYQWLKMSKSKGNAVTPDEMAERYGADALRLYVLFEAPFEDTIQWSEERMVGTFRFLNRVWDVVGEVAEMFDRNWSAKIGGANSDDERGLRRRTHQAIAKVTGDIADLRFNTAVSELMKHSDALRKFVAANGAASPAAHEAAEMLTKLLAPLSPHIADELYERLGYADCFLYREAWPVADTEVAAEEEVTLVVQVNGKLRDRITIVADSDAAACEMTALQSEKVREALLDGGKTVKKVIVVPGKLVNVVIG